MNLVHLDCIAGIQRVNRKKIIFNQWWARWVRDRVEKKVAELNLNGEEEEEGELKRLKNHNNQMKAWTPRIKYQTRRGTNYK